MAISLQKGGNVNISKTDPSLSKIVIGLGWEARATSAKSFDLDASLFMVGQNGKVRNDRDFIFYGQMVSPCKSIEHTGDNQTGIGDGDDESIKINLGKVPQDITRLVIAVTIHEAISRKQNFGMVRDAFIRVVNEDVNIEMFRFDLSEDFSTETAVVFGEVYRHNGDWKFRAVGEGYGGGLKAICEQHGIEVI